MLDSMVFHWKLMTGLVDSNTTARSQYGLLLTVGTPLCGNLSSAKAATHGSDCNLRQGARHLEGTYTGDFFAYFLCFFCIFEMFGQRFLVKIT